VTLVSAKGCMPYERPPLSKDTIIAGRLRRRGDGIPCRLELTDGRMRVVDFVVVGIGVEPETALAGSAGLRLENGVSVNSKLETEVEGVFAAGDCCSFPHALYEGKRLRLESWRNAQRQGEHAARNMLGADATFDAAPWFWSDQYSMTLQVAGLPNEGVETVVRDLPDGARLWFHVAADGRLVAATGLGVGNGVGREIRFTEMLISRRRKPS
jgi:3-phenylpropionate/trans-cinnamate dioxygenase ferredoxin reductase component